MTDLEQDSSEELEASSEVEDTPNSEDSISADVERAYNELESNAENGETNEKKEQAYVQEEKEGGQEKVAPEEQAQSDTEVAYEPPRSWNKKDRETWVDIPPSAQATILRRQEEVDAYLTQRSMQMAEKDKRYSALDEALASERERWALSGINEAQAVKQLITAHNFLERDPIAGIQWLANSYGIDLTNLAQQATTQPRVDPQQQALMTEVQQLKAQIANRERQELEAHNQSIVSEVASFAQEMDGSGNLKHPDFETVRADMQPLVQFLTQQHPDARPRAILEEAYNRAVRANPVTWEKMQKAQAAARISQTQKTVERAKRAGSSVSGAPVGNPKSYVPDSIEDAVNQAGQELGLW